MLSNKKKMRYSDLVAVLDDLANAYENGLHNPPSYITVTDDQFQTFKKRNPDKSEYRGFLLVPR